MMRAAATCLLILAVAGVIPAVSAAQQAHRKLKSASLFPMLSGSVSGNIPISPGSGVTVPFSIQLPFGGTTGTPSPTSPKRYYKVNCDNPRPTFIVVPGISGSQLDATQAGNAGGCPSFDSARKVFADVSWYNNLGCFAHILSVGYDSSSGRYSNSSGSQTWAWEGGFPDGTDMQLFRLYFGGLLAHLENNYGYKRGVDLFAAPYDWRLDFDGLNQIGQFDQMAARISAAVQQNCGQKAIILAHSLGMNVVLRMLREPRFQSWRQQNVRGLVMVGGTVGGSAAAIWQLRLSGVPDFFPAWSNLVPDFKLAMLPTFSWEAALYQAALGMPSTAVLMPSASVYGKDHVLVRTPSRSYTVGQQKQLLKDMGDEQAAALLDKVQAQNQALIAAGPIPGIESFCVYGIATGTPMTLEYNEDIKSRQVMRRPARIIRGPGDGSVDLKTLRMCQKLVSSSSNVVEIDDAAIDHSAVTREPAGLAALDTIFAKLGMRKGTPVAAAEAMGYPVTNSPRGKASSTVEERGTKG